MFGRNLCLFLDILEKSYNFATDNILFVSYKYWMIWTICYQFWKAICSKVRPYFHS